MNDFNEMITTEFRANRGHVSTYGFGDRLVLVHHVGAKSGESRIAPLMGIPVGDSWLIAASAAGAAKHPGWYFNLIEAPDTEIEVPAPEGADTVDGVDTVAVRAVDLMGAERDAAWQTFLAEAPAFAGYESRAAPRVIPVVRLDRR
ncbi:MAG: hypothetical protein RI885_2468 [Actinomycetota bacterium]|jgi:deazaflavin-dependent oxidoreductase (nitroreductase family)